MLYAALLPLADEFTLFNLVRYLTFRTGAALLTALIIAFVLGPWLINWLRRRQGAGQPIRDDGPETHFAKMGTPTMGGLMILLGMSVTDISQKAIANLGWENIRMTAPVFHGDTIYGESEVLEKRESKSRPTQGIVTVKSLAKNQDGVVVCEFVRKVLVPKRGHAVDD